MRLLRLFIIVPLATAIAAIPLPFVAMGTIMLFSATGYASQSNPAAKTASDLEALTGGHTRVVWVQDRINLNDVFARGSELHLLGYDSQDGDGERLLLPDPGSFTKPLFSPDGTQVIYTNLASNGVYALDWASRQMHRLTTGFALAVWRDPQTQIDWVYVGSQPLPDDEYSYQRVDRVQLFNPEKTELVMDHLPVGTDNFQLSADGRIAGGNFPWPECGIVHMDTLRFERLGRGCWPALSPDNAYRFWIFDGSHRNLLLFDTRNHQRTTIPMASAPGIEGHEAYHPRWSNHPQVMTMTGPYKIRQGGNNIRGGGADVEILIGRFSSDFQRLETWVQLTSNEWANFFPDVWVDLEEPDADESLSTETEEPQVSASPQWPRNREGLVLLWEHAAAQNEIELTNGRRRIFRPEAGGLARFGEHHTMWVEGGHFVQSDPPTLRVPFSIEVVAHDIADQALMFSLDGNWKLNLEDGTWWFESPSHRISLGRAEPKPLQHIVLLASQNSLQLIVNGHALPPAVPNVPLESISGERLYWGGEPGRPGRGRLSHIAIVERKLSMEDIERNYEWVQDYFAQRPSEPVHHVQGRVIAQSAIPAPEDIAPYRRALVFNEYEILNGSLQGERVLAAHWAILDGRILPTAERPIGMERELALTLFNQRPELEGERVAMDSEDFLLEWYYDLNL